MPQSPVLWNKANSTPRPLQRGAVLRLTHLICALLVHLFYVQAAPLRAKTDSEDVPSAPDDAQKWIYLSTAIGLVLLGGAFAGLTIALVAFAPLDGFSANLHRLQIDGSR